MSLISSRIGGVARVSSCRSRKSASHPHSARALRHREAPLSTALAAGARGRKSRLFPESPRYYPAHPGANRRGDTFRQKSSAHCLKPRGTASQEERDEDPFRRRKLPKAWSNSIHEQG